MIATNRIVFWDLFNVAIPVEYLVRNPASSSVAPIHFCLPETSLAPMGAKARLTAVTLLKPGRRSTDALKTMCCEEKVLSPEQKENEKIRRKPRTRG